MLNKGVEENQTLYETVARNVATLISEGTFATGDRLPSVRGLSHRMRVSLSTAVEAYRLLEDRGIVEVRPQSGHYVASRFASAPEEPRASRPLSVPTEVSTSDRIMKIMRDANNPALAPFGAAFPNPDLLPLDRLNRATSAVLRRDRSLAHACAIPPGCEALRIQIARRALAAGCVLTPEQIVLTSGCQEAITLALRAVCRPGDTVAVESPTFFNFLHAIEVLGLRALELSTSPRDGISLAALSDALSRHSVRACLLVTNFSNPLGYSMPTEKKKELIRILAYHETPLIEDDIYGDLAHAAERPDVAKAYDSSGLAILCSSFTKTVSPGSRVGWIAAGRFQSEIERLKVAMNIASATLPQLAIAELLENGGYDHYLRGVRRTYARQTAAMAQAVGSAFPPGTRVSRPEGGFVLWVECPETVDALALYDRAMASGITLAPGPLFSARQRYRHCIRLNAGYWSPQGEAAIGVLGDIVTAMAR